jgi:mono/diheme cytochrome c family protein
MSVRLVLPLLSLSLAIALAVQDGGDQELPPAEVGRVMALSVATDGSVDDGWGVLFPITLTTGPGSGYFDVNAELDDRMRQTVRDSIDWLAAQRGDPDFPLPNTFPDGLDYRLEFVRGARQVAGDSAGVALGCALYSAVTETPVLSEVAVTGAVDAQGQVHAVAHIRKKLDAVLEHDLKTMILPAENAWRTEGEARAVWQAAVPHIQVVFIRDMREALFFVTGPYGPRAHEYRRYQQELDRAMELFGAGEFERSRANLAWIRAWHPGDSTALAWIAECSDEYSKQLVQAASIARREGRLEIADFLLRRAADLDLQGTPPSDAAPPASKPSALPAADPEPSAALPVAFLERPARTPSDGRWSAAEPITVPLTGAGSPAVVAAESGWERFSLAVSYEDGSGQVEANPGRWYRGDAGWSERQREDRVAVCLGPDDRVREGALRALEYRGSPGCDSWVVGAGPLRHLKAAADLAPVDRQPGFDTGTAPLLRNAAAEGGPLGSYDGLLGAAHDPMTLGANEAAYLKGDATVGAQVFESSCTECHGVPDNPAAALTADLSLRPEGSQALLEYFLGGDAIHAPILSEESMDDVTAYLRTMEPPPAWLAVPPEGSAADVQAYALFEDGRWTWCLTRAASTGNADDWDLAGQPEVKLAVAVLDGASGVARVSGELTLEWETPPAR